MNRRQPRFAPTGCWFLVGNLLIAGGLLVNPLLADDEDSQTDPPTVQQLLERIDNIERTVNRLKGNNDNPAPQDSREPKLYVLLETPHLGFGYDGTPNGMRYFVARLLFANLTDQPITLKQQQIHLQVDGQNFDVGRIPDQLQFQVFQIGDRSFPLRNSQPAEETTIEPGETASTWVFFSNLPQGNDVPQLALTIQQDDKRQSVNVNDVSLAAMGRHVERIGPRDTMGLVTIDGQLDTINAGHLADTLDELAVNKVSRVVLHWTESAKPLDPQLLGWLHQSAALAGHGEAVSNMFPTLSATIRELHLSEIPNHTEENADSLPSRRRLQSRVHSSLHEALSAAMKGVYEAISQEELIHEIQQGHPLLRPAALATGGGRLPAEHLPLLLKYADDDESNLQQSALQALKHFGEPEAIEKLLHYARLNQEPLTGTAIESLAGSRYTAAHEALLELLQNEAPDSKTTIVQILARYPRPLWAETIFDFVHSDHPEIVIEALRALNRIGHPKLHEVLKESLGSKNPELRDAAFGLLIARNDTDSEELALQYTLEFLQESPPTERMYQLLNETKDRRAIPLLLKHFETSKSDRGNLISTLSQIGDESVAEVFVENYPSLQGHEKANVLNALIQFRSPDFRKLAGEALMSEDSSLVAAACQGLQIDGSPAAVQMLIEALENSENSNTWSYTSNALATLGTPEARLALTKARESDQPNKQNYANNALRNLRQRSPGFQYIYQAQEFARQKKWDEAIQQYGISLQVDPNLPEAYAGRANALMKKEQFDEAHKDYRKALELDPYNSLAVTGIGVIQAINGKEGEAIEFVEKHREKFQNDMLFSYNTACVYGRALEQLEKNEQAEDRQERMEAYQKQAIEDLKRAIELGFQDFNWMQEDPDLKSLQESPEFKKLTGPQQQEEENNGPNKPAVETVPTLPRL